MNPTETHSHYEKIGGEKALRALVDRFYDHMDELSETQPIREMHPNKQIGREGGREREVWGGWEIVGGW